MWYRKAANSDLFFNHGENIVSVVAKTPAGKEILAEFADLGGKSSARMSVEKACALWEFAKARVNVYGNPQFNKAFQQYESIKNMMSSADEDEAEIQQRSEDFERRLKNVSPLGENATLQDVYKQLDFIFGDSDVEIHIDEVNSNGYFVGKTYDGIKVLNKLNIQMWARYALERVWNYADLIDTYGLGTDTIYDSEKDDSEKDDVV
jgi:hypothetical protein